MADIFANIAGIKGESVDVKHKDEIEVLSISWGVANTGTIGGGGGGGAGKATFQDLSLVHKIDKATPKLLEACATGKHLPSATITQRKAGKGQPDYLVIKMNDVIITGVAFDDPSNEMAAETVKLTFAQVDLGYLPFKADGSPDQEIHFKFDLKANKGG